MISVIEWLEWACQIYADAWAPPIFRAPPKFSRLLLAYAIIYIAGIYYSAKKTVRGEP